jgi:hypothetical protein
MNRFEARHDVSDLSFIEDICWGIFWPETSDFESFYFGSSIDKFEFVSLFDFSRKELEIDDNSFI